MRSWTNGGRAFRFVAGILAVTTVPFIGCDSNLNLGNLIPGLTEQLSFAPTSGTTAGGTKITVRGTGFTNDMVVLFDGQTPSEINVINGTLIEVVTPPHDAGAVPVAIVDSAGNSMTIETQFTFISPDIANPAVVASITPAEGAGGTRVAIAGENFKPETEVLFGGFLGQGTEVVNDRLITSIAPSQAPGTVDIAIITPGQPAIVREAAFEYIEGGVADDGTAPRVVGASSLDNKTIMVTFSKPMGMSAAYHENYRISGSDSAFLVITEAELMRGKTSVKLTTLTQDFDDYTLHVVGVRDMFGNDLAAPDGLLSSPEGPDPSRAAFRGTAPTQEEIDFDTDGDGFGDWFEMKGWLVTVRLANGTVETFHVTSDPFQRDTDLDGLDDSIENQWSFDPRTDDTDADHLSDFDEFNLWYSDPLAQDTDEDGFGDHLEITFFQTSAILADTDGDQLTDSDEVLNRNRNPRIADLPVVGITVDESRLELDQRYTYTDQFGQQQTIEESFSNTLQRDVSSSRTDNGGTTTTAVWNIKGGLKVGASAKDGIYGEINVEGGYSNTKETVNTWTTESSTNTSESYNRAVNRGTQVTSLSDITRETLAARISTAVTLTSGNDIAFNVSDLEVSVLQADPRDRSRFIPVATLVPNNPDTVYSLGPLVPARGPFVFDNNEVFPNLVEELMKDPRGLIFRIANFNMTDELGRNFAFSSQDVVERTARLIIDYGNGTQRTFLVATAGPFDEFGRPTGITIEQALAAIGLEPWQPRTDGASDEDPELGDLDDASDTRPKAVDPDIVNSYGTRTDTRVVRGETISYRRVTRIRGVQEDSDYDTVEPGKPNDGSFWAVFFFDPNNPNPNNDPENPSANATTDFGSLRMKAGQTYALAFVQDKDKDSITSREEFFSGSSDADEDTDNDSLADYVEIRGQWTDEGLGAWLVATDRLPGGYRTYTAPYDSDSDDDDLTDDAEYALCRYRYQMDGMPPADAFVLGWFDDDDANPEDPTVTWDSDPLAIPYLFPPSDGLATTWHRDVDPATGIPVAFPTNRASLDPRKRDTDEDGVSDSDEVNGYAFTLYDDDLADGMKRRIFVYSDPLKSDTDGDGILDGMERLFGTNPALSDSGVVFDDDLDGLPNRAERDGWTITINGVETLVVSNPDDPDSDNDNIPDYIEWVIGTNPWYPDGVMIDPNVVAPGFDTDGDGLSDFDEWDGAITPPDEDEFAFCATVPNCAGYFVNDLNHGTDPNEADTDSDGLDDGFEVQTGWEVTLFGEVAGYQVYSDPLVNDGDNDGWEDGAEFTAGTDPTKIDTDDDGTPDPWEAGRTARNGARDPLRPDQRVKIEYVYLYVLDDGINGSGNAGYFEMWASYRFGNQIFDIIRLTDFFSGGPFCGGSGDSVCRNNCPEGATIQFREGGEFNFPAPAAGQDQFILGPGDSISPAVHVSFWNDCHVGVPTRFWRPFEDGSGIREYPVESEAFVIDSISSGTGYIGVDDAPRTTVYIVITVD